MTIILLVLMFSISILAVVCFSLLQEVNVLRAENQRLWTALQRRNKPTEWWQTWQRS